MIVQLLKKRYAPVALVALVSVVAWLITYRLNLVTTYNDAMSHLDVARLVIDDKQPGIAQLGSVWLPLSHILMLPLIWNNWAWHSGFAGSFISMLSYIAAVVGVYAIMRELVAKKWPAIVAAAAFGLNPNALYLQSTPLTEMLFVALLIGSILFLVKYLKYDDTRFLLGPHY